MKTIGTCLVLFCVTWWAAERWPRPDLAEQAHRAAVAGDAAELSWLLSRGLDVNAEVNGVTPLELAAGAGRAEAVRVLLDGGARVDRKNASGVTPLIWAVHGGNVEAVRLLVRAGADVNAAEYNGITPLIMAASRDPAIVRTLLDAGADKDARSSAGTTAYDAAAAAENEENMVLLAP